MKPEEIMAISELAKMALMIYMNYMKQAGLTEEQIDNVYQNAKATMLIRDPANIPS